MAAHKFIINNAGTLAEEQAVVTSAGVTNAGYIPALNTSGFLDQSVINGIVVSAGVTSAAKVVMLDATGHLDTTVLPTGVGAETVSITTSEALSAGAFVNIYSNAGTANVRNADATVAGKEAMGFVLTAFASGVTATVYLSGVNTAVTGQTPGKVYLSTTPGVATSTSPSATGNISQLIGVATSATAISYSYSKPITLA